MGYSDFLRARRQAGKAPSIEPMRWSQKQRERIGNGLCVKCGQEPSGADSYLCADCAAQDTLEIIRAEIENARRRIQNA